MEKNLKVLGIVVLTGCLLWQTRIDRINAQPPVPNNVPIGTIMAFAGELTPVNTQRLRQAGWLVCDGSSLRRLTPTGQPTEYASLYAVIRETFGDGREEPPTPGGVSAKTGDFNLPDMRGRFLRGVDNGTGRDPDANSRLPMRQGGKGGDQVGSIEGDEFKKHNHTLTDNGHAHPLPRRIIGDCHGGYGTGGGNGGCDIHDIKVNNTESKTTGITIADAGTTGETRPKNINVFWIIKYR